jgi:hypothetical protein
MKRSTTPLDLWKLSVTCAAIGAEANMVVAMRMMGMFGFWTMSPGEALRMVAEKQAVLGEAGIGMASAIARGASPAAIASAGAAPVRRRTKANVKRLVRLGPSTP